MQSSDEAIERFRAMGGVKTAIEFLDGEGRVLPDERGAVEARLTRRSAGKLHIIRVDVGQVVGIVRSGRAGADRSAA